MKPTSVMEGLGRRVGVGLLARGFVPALRTPEYWRAVSLLDVVLIKPYSMYPTHLPRGIRAAVITTWYCFYRDFCF